MANDNQPTISPYGVYVGGPPPNQSDSPYNFG